MQQQYIPTMDLEKNASLYSIRVVMNYISIVAFSFYKWEKSNNFNMKEDIEQQNCATDANFSHLEKKPSCSWFFLSLVTFDLPESFLLIKIFSFLTYVCAYVSLSENMKLWLFPVWTAHVSKTSFLSDWTHHHSKFTLSST